MGEVKDPNNVIIIGADGAGHFGREMAKEMIKRFKEKEVSVEFDVSYVEYNLNPRIEKKQANKRKAVDYICGFIIAYGLCRNKAERDKVIASFKRLKKHNCHLNIPMTNLNKFIELA